MRQINEIRHVFHPQVPFSVTASHPSLMLVYLIPVSETLGKIPIMIMLPDWLGEDNWNVSHTPSSIHVSPSRQKHVWVYEKYE